MGDISVWSFLIPYIVIFALFYIFLIIPQKLREKKIREMLSSLKEGDNVITIGGLKGILSEISNDDVIIEIIEGTKIKFAKWAIKSVVKNE